MLRAYASGGSGGNRSRSGSRKKSPATDFNYSQRGPQYTPNGYPVVVSRSRGNYSYYMNGTQINSKSRLSMRQVDDYFRKRDASTDLRYR